MIRRNRGFIRISRAIVDYTPERAGACSELDAFLVVSKLADFSTGCWDGNGDILARELGVTPRRARRLLRRLISNGYLERIKCGHTQHGGTRYRYFNPWLIAFPQLPQISTGFRRRERSEIVPYFSELKPKKTTTTKQPPLFPHSEENRKSTPLLSEKPKPEVQR